jgi:hypothetical protein
MQRPYTKSLYITAPIIISTPLGKLSQLAGARRVPLQSRRVSFKMLHQCLEAETISRQAPFAVLHHVHALGGLINPPSGFESHIESHGKNTNSPTQTTCTAGALTTAST